MSTLRYALIGSGMMGQEHIRNIALLPETAVVAVSDPDPGMRARAADLAGPGCAAYDDHRALLSAGGIDALVIASPNDTHVSILEDALATGLPILVEKPLCTTSADCRRVLALAQGRAAPVWVAMEYRYMAPVTRLVEEVRNGNAGRLRMLTVREHRFPFLQKVGDWNRFSERTGGTLVEKCCHFFDLMRLVTGSEPVRVYASGGRDENHLDERYGDRVPDIIDNAYVIVDFANGVRAMLEICMFAEGSWFQEEITALGSAAKVEALVPGPARFWPGGAERESEIVISPRDPKGPRRETVHVDPTILAAGDHHGSTFVQHERFRLAALGRGTVEVTLEDGLKAVAVGEAGERSIVERMPVSL